MSSLMPTSIAPIHTEEFDNTCFTTLHVLSILGVHQVTLNLYVAKKGFPKLKYRPGSREISSRYPRKNSPRYEIKAVHAWLCSRIGVDSQSKVERRLMLCRELTMMQIQLRHGNGANTDLRQVVAEMEVTRWALEGQRAIAALAAWNKA